MTDSMMTCAECDALLPDYLEEELGAHARTTVEGHAASCARCQGILRDIDAIRSEAAQLPELEPSHDLWLGIEARIQPVVVPIATQRGWASPSRRMMALAASLLIVVSSSVTYLATRSLNSGTQQPERAAETQNVVNRQIASQPKPVDGAPSPSAGVAAQPSVQPSLEPPSQHVRGDRAVRSSLVSAASVSPSASEIALAPEIQQLQQTLRQRREQLDPATVKVVEDNLNLIDAALKQAREALSRDPASGFLNEQMDNVLHKKIQLLRTVALLPSRS